MIVSISLNYAVFSRTFTPSRPFNASVEGGHCQGPCRPQWLFYILNWDGTEFSYARDIHSPQCWEPDFNTTYALPAVTMYWHPGCRRSRRTC